MKYDTEKILAAILTALKAAAAIAPKHDTGGSFNFDHAFIPVPGMRSKQADEITTACQGLVTLSTVGGQRRLRLGGFSEGNKRTAIAEALAESMTAQGIKAFVYYRAD